MIDNLVMYGELIIFGVINYLHRVYQPWMAVAVVAVLALMALLFVYSVLMQLFNHSQRWYHKVLYLLPAVKSCGQWMFRKGHRVGAVWGFEEGYKSKGISPKKLKHGKIVRALERAGM